MQVEFHQEVIDYLWIIIDKESTNNWNKSKLTANISQSLLLADQVTLFYNSVYLPLLKYYLEINPADLRLFFKIH